MQLPYNLATHDMQQGLHEGKLLGRLRDLKKTSESIGGALYGKDEFVYRTTPRLAKCFNLHETPSHDYNTLLAVSVNACPQRCLFWTFSIDGKMHEEIAGCTERFGLGDWPCLAEEVDADPPIISPVRSTSVREEFVDYCAIFKRSDDE